MATQLPSTAIHPKVAGATIGAALSGILVWALNTYGHANIPDTVQAEITAIITAIFGYFTPA